MRVVTLTQQLNDPRHLRRVAEEEETESGDGGATDVVVDVRDGDVEELADGGVVARSGVGEGERVDTAVAKDGVLCRAAPSSQPSDSS
jgi:hypothetical protein